VGCSVAPCPQAVFRRSIGHIPLLKCLIGVPEVDCNGHRVSAAGIRPLTSNVKAIQAILVPINTKQLLRFVCTASNYLNIVPDFTEISEPLRQLLKADEVWNWWTACQHSFELLKTKIVSPPVLAHFDVIDRDLCRFVSRRRCLPVSNTSR